MFYYNKRMYQYLLHMYLNYYIFIYIIVKNPTNAPFNNKNNSINYLSNSFKFLIEILKIKVVF